MIYNDNLMRMKMQKIDRKLNKTVAGIIVFVMVAIFCYAASAMAAEAEHDELNCMTIIVGKDASATGCVLVAHNEDDGGRVVSRHGYVKAAQWPEGTVLPAEPLRADVPQVSHTFGYYWSQLRKDEKGLSSGDLFFNENGVCIVSNNNSKSKMSLEDESRVTDGGLEYNLRRIVAERAKSARHALELIIELVETWGYAPSGRAYTVADSQEAFMIQIVSGRRYMAARVPYDMIVVMPNHYTFHGLDDVEEMYYSDDLVEYAVQMGWYVPAVPGDYSDFDFAVAYQEAESYGREYNVLRQKYGLEILFDEEWNVDEKGLPFAVQAKERITWEKLAKVLSYHYEGTERDKRFGPGSAPHDTTVRRICTGTTVEASIFEFSDEPLLTTVWTAYGRPCQLPFVPLHPLAGKVDAVDYMEDPAKEMAEHLHYRYQATVYRENGWQAFRNFENLHEMLYSEQIDGVTALKERLETAYDMQNQAMLTELKALSASGNISEMTARLNAADENVCMDALAELERYMEENFRLAELQTGESFSLSSPDAQYVIVFSCDGEPVEDSLYFGLGFTDVRKNYAKCIPGTLANLSDGVYSAAFDSEKLMKYVPGEGEYEFFLGGKTKEGGAFAGMTLLTFTK